MKYFSRIVAILDNNHSFSDVTNTKRELFHEGDAVCVVYTDTRLIHPRFILEYGPFHCKESAIEKGQDLARQLRLFMAKYDIPFSFSGIIGSAEPSKMHVFYGGIERWDALPVNLGQEKPLRPVIENSNVGLSVYSVENSLEELTFVGGDFSSTQYTTFAFQNRPMANWDKNMDLSLSLISSSVGLKDNRAALLLRVMAVEVLVSSSEPRAAKELNAIEQTIHALSCVGLDREDTAFITQLLSSRKEKSVQQKTAELLSEYLPDAVYGGVSAPAFFKRCYGARSAFTHNGKWKRITAEMIHELKKLCVDLLCSIASSPD